MIFNVIYKINRYDMLLIVFFDITNLKIDFRVKMNFIKKKQTKIINDYFVLF